MGSERVTFKTVDGVALKGDFFRAGSSSSPGVVMAQGLSLLKEHYIEDTARRFQEAGISALVYDHRGYGSSGGHPRHQTDPLQQATPRPGSRSRTWAARAFYRDKLGLTPADERPGGLLYQSRGC
jgi:dienelactone hydrolase